MRQQHSENKKSKQREIERKTFLSFGSEHDFYLRTGINGNRNIEKFSLNFEEKEVKCILHTIFSAVFSLLNERKKVKI